MFSREADFSLIETMNQNSSEKSKVTEMSLVMDTSEFKETQSHGFRTCGNIENRVIKEDVT